jgi:hypothetical protein
MPSPAPTKSPSEYYGVMPHSWYKVTFRPSVVIGAVTSGQRTSKPSPAKLTTTPTEYPTYHTDAKPHSWKMFPFPPFFLPTDSAEEKN